MSSQTSNFGLSAGPASNFLQALSEGMHAMAQPLTVVQANLETVLFTGMTLEEYKQAAEDSLSNMSRGIELLSYVRELIRINSTACTLAPTLLAAPVEAAIEDLRQVFDDRQVQVSLLIADRGITVLGSGERLRQVFFYVLQAAYSCANAGDVVCLHVNRIPGGEFAEVRVAITTPTGAEEASVDVAGVSTTPAQAKNTTQLQPPVGRGLALAEAIIFRQCGEFESVTAPFSVGLRLPIAQAGNEERIISRFPPPQSPAPRSPATR